jgi:hypothetical protein
VNKSFVALGFVVMALLLGASPLVGCKNTSCCPIEPPSCSCFAIGGSAQAGMCPKLCDAPPINWKRTVDMNDCPVLVQDPPGGSCLSPPPRDGATDGPTD